MTVEELKSQTRKDLAGMAKNRGVSGWHAMRKDELVKALSKIARRDHRKNSNGRRSATPSKNGHRAATNGNGSRQGIYPASQSVAGKRGAHSETQGRNGTLPSEKSPLLKNLALENGTKSGSTDRLFVVAHDAYWLHALWDLRSNTIKRAEAGLGLEWHSAKPVIRVLDVSSDENRHCVEKFVRDIEIHGGINHWYIEVKNPPGVYQLQIGYLTTSGRFFSLVRSNIVDTPSPGSHGISGENWNQASENYEPSNDKPEERGNLSKNGKLQELIDQKLRRPLSTHPLTNFLPPGSSTGDHEDLRLEIDAELILYGSANPAAHLAISGKPVELREDGSFTIRWNLQEGRQVIPAAITSPNGAMQQTVVLAVERNTKHLEPQHFDSSGQS